jgi:hypothetical protein
MAETYPWDEHFARHWRGEVHDPVLAALFGNDQRLPHVDVNGVSQALAGFALEPQVPMEWLAMAVKRAIAHCLPNPDRMSDVRPGPVDARDAFIALSGRARALADEIDDLPLDIAAPLSLGLDAKSFREFQSWLDGVRKLADSFEKVAGGIVVKPGAWRSSEAKSLREEQALSLIPVFQDAFGVEATITDSRTGDAPDAQWPDFNLGRFAEFFARVMRLATGDTLTRDQVRDATKAARARFKQQPFTYSPGIIPRPPL